MLVLRRKQGQWIEVTHKSGDVMRIKVNTLAIQSKEASVSLAFDDAARNFDIQRPERARKDPVQQASAS